MLDLSNKSRGWKELPGYPGCVREDAILVVQNNGVSPCLYLLGGQTETEEGLSSCLTDGYVYNPQLGKWSSLGSDFPKGICAAVASGANHILLFQKEPEDTQHLKKENALWKYHTITQTLVKSECIPGTYDTMQVLQRTVPSLYSVAMPVPERIDCTAFKGILFLWKRGWDLSISL